MSVSIINYKPDMEISYPCAVRGMPQREYHGRPEMSFSRDIKPAIGLTASEYLWKKKQPFEKSDAMRIGSLFHTARELGSVDALLEHPDTMMIARIKWTTKEGKIQQAEVMAHAEHDLPWVTIDEVELIREMYRITEMHPAAAVLSAQATERELALFWVDADVGPSRCLIDICNPLDGWFADWKTTRARCSQREFSAEARKLHYKAQLVWYAMGWLQVFGVKPACDFIATRNEYPISVGVFSMDEDAMAAGLSEVDQAVGTVLRSRTITDADVVFPETERVPLLTMEWELDEEEIEL